MEQKTKGEYGLAENVQLVVNRDDLKDIIREEVGQALAEQLAIIEEMRLAAQNEIVEAHVLAEELGKHVETLARWAKAGLICRVENTVGREVYYYRNQFTREKEALAAKKGIKKKEGECHA